VSPGADGAGADPGPGADGAGADGPGADGTDSALAELAGPLLGRCTFGPAGGAVTCAVSGGPDSMALLVLAAASGRAVTAVHVDHGLRPGSATEADLVAAVARRFGARFRSHRVAVAPGPNLEARARAARWSVLPADAATGHTMDDQAETVLANLLRGSGRDGAAGMRRGPRHPILGLRRREARALCDALGVPYVLDPSNDDPRFLRNRIRHELLPLCAAVARRDPVPLLCRHAELTGDEADLLDRLAHLAVGDPARAAALTGVPEPLARRAVRQWLRAEGATAPDDGPGGGRHAPTRAAVDAVLDVAAQRARGTELPGGARVRRTAGRLRVEPPGEAPTVRNAPSGNLGPVTTEEVAQAAPAWATPAVGPLLVGAEALAVRVAELGAQITADYVGDPPLLVGVLKGAMIFMSDLCRAIALPVDVDFMAVSSYGSATRTSGVVRIVKDLDAELTGRHVVVVEDIIDSGLTLNYLRKYLQARRPASVEICALLVKAGEQRVDLDLRYVGFTIPSAFVVGYGLDVDERYRNLPGVHVYGGSPPGPVAGGAAAAAQEDHGGR
jgi:hypoxanthine phosphoribosyltransferase